MILEGISVMFSIGVKRIVRIFEYSFENFKRASIRNFALDRFFFCFFCIGILCFKKLLLYRSSTVHGMHALCMPLSHYSFL